MQAYQADIAHYNDSDTQILGISVDSAPSNKRFAAELNLSFPLLSDFKRTVTQQYGILDAEKNLAIRTTYVVDKQGIVRYIDQGSEAIDPSGVKQMCTRLQQEQ
ncbi:MAG: redoxin domain-containing protein [Acidobacteria bacterium]|nr:redoxin domain-containing protein [Acidobacteriota bacterium]